MGGGHEHEDDPDSDRAANEHEHACGLADRTAAGTPSRVVPPIVHSGGDSVIHSGLQERPVIRGMCCKTLCCAANEQ